MPHMLHDGRVRDNADGAMDVLSREQQKALDSLTAWIGSGRVGALTGFPGTGKTEVSHRLQELAATNGLQPIEVEAPAEGVAGLTDVLEHVAAEAGVEAFKRLAPTERVQQLGLLLSEPVLLVIEEAHRLLTPRGDLDHNFANVVRALSRPGRGRLLLVMSRELEMTRDTERLVRVPLGPMTTDEATGLLDRALAQAGRPDAVLPLRRAEVAQRLGYNPRAILYLVAALRRAPLDELLGQATEAWEAIEPHISAELVEQLERNLLDQIVADLDPETESWLRALSVLRQSVREPDLRQLAPNETVFAQMRAALVDRHLLDHRQGRYRVESLAREVALTRLAEHPDQHEAAHRRVAGIYSRHFTGKQVVAGREQDFVEARYHLALAQETQKLGEVAQRFITYLTSEITWATPLPHILGQRDVRILTLSALMDAGIEGPGALWFHLAKLLVERAQGNDLVRARAAVRIVCRSRAIWEAWRLHLSLEAESGVSAADIERIARQGIGHHPGSAELYVYAAKFLELAKTEERALALLREGMAKVPPTQNLFSLYQLTGELLARKGDLDGALALLREGLKRVSVTSGGSKLAEGAAFLALALDSPRSIRDLLELLRSIDGTDRQVVLCHVVLAEAEDRWAEAADLAAKWKSFPTPYAPLISHHAIALIATGRPAEALQMLDESVARSGSSPDTPIWSWVEALAAAHTGDTLRAAAATARLPDAKDRPGPTVDELIAWWARPKSITEVHPSYAFPRLPPGCTGRPTVLIAPPNGAGVVLHAPLPTHHKDVMHAAPASPAPPSWLSSEPWNANRIDQVLSPASRVGVHVLGSFDRRITFYNQQVRALLSVRAMHELGRLKARTRVAVVGGGGAGVTAALAAHLLDAEVHIYEKSSVLLPYQLAADHRWLHPHVYDWPERPMSEEQARMPLLDWKAGRASDVVSAIARQFREQFPLERIHHAREVVHIEGGGAKGFTLFFTAGPEAKADVVILAVGFGTDGAVRAPVVPGDTTPGYWDADGIAACAGRQVIVGGAGDGGLIDAVRAAIRGFQHHVTLQEVLDQEEGRRLAEAMLAVDRTAREEKERAGVLPDDLFNRYITQVKPSNELLDRIRNLPRQASTVSLVSNTPGLLRVDTALVNRLMVFLLERAGRIEFISGTAEFRPNGTVIVRLRGGRERELPGAHLALRRGPDPSHLRNLLPEAAAWLVPPDRRVEELELTRNLDVETWLFWRDKGQK